jgi:hypothetical protein
MINGAVARCTKGRINSVGLVNIYRASAIKSSIFSESSCHELLKETLCRKSLFRFQFTVSTCSLRMLSSTKSVEGASVAAKEKGSHLREPFSISAIVNEPYISSYEMAAMVAP